jgi:hypothetical protein
VLFLTLVAPPQLWSQAVPDTVLGLTRADSVARESGVLFVYRDAAGHEAQVSTYLIPETRLASPDSVRLELEVDAFVAELAESEARGEYDSHQVAVRSDVDVSGPDGDESGRVVVAILARGGAVDVSFLHLFVVDEAYLAVRLTLPFQEWRESTLPNFGLRVAEFVLARAGDRR